MTDFDVSFLQTLTIHVPNYQLDARILITSMQFDAV